MKYQKLLGDANALLKYNVITSRISVYDLSECRFYTLEVRHLRRTLYQLLQNAPSKRIAQHWVLMILDLKNELYRNMHSVTWQINNTMHNQRKEG